MSLRQEIETWVSALAHFDRQEYDGALLAFDEIADTSKILFNCGIIYATLGEHGQAVDCFQRAIQLDQYMAISYFQQGVSNFLLGDFEEALANFNDVLLYLRGNRHIDYTQLGLKFKLHSCEALFNRGLCYWYLQEELAANQDLLFASREKAAPEHSVIDEAIHESAQGFTVFSVSAGLVFRPNEAKVRNLQARDYLGRARLVAHDRKQQQGGNQLVVDDRPQMSLQQLSLDERRDDVSFAAVHLIRSGLSSRKGQEFGSPLNRPIWHPTPPPEPEQRPAMKRPSQAQLGSRRTESPPRSRLRSQHGLLRPKAVAVSTTSIDRLPGYNTDGMAGESRHESHEPDNDRGRSKSRHRPGRLDLGMAAFHQVTAPTTRVLQAKPAHNLLPRLNTDTHENTHSEHSSSVHTKRIDSAIEAQSSTSSKGNLWRN